MKPKLQPLPRVFKVDVAFFYNDDTAKPSVAHFLVKAANRQMAREVLKLYFSGREGRWEIQGEIQPVQALTLGGY